MSEPESPFLGIAGEVDVAAANAQTARRRIRRLYAAAISGDADARAMILSGGDEIVTLCAIGDCPLDLLQQEVERLRAPRPASVRAESADEIKRRRASGRVRARRHRQRTRQTETPAERERRLRRGRERAAQWYSENRDHVLERARERRAQKIST